MLGQPRLAPVGEVARAADVGIEPLRRAHVRVAGAAQLDAGLARGEVGQVGVA